MQLKNVMTSLVPKHNVAHFENFVGFKEWSYGQNLDYHILVQFYFNVCI